MRDVDVVIDEFEERWNEAKESGCTAILFSQDKWSMIDILLKEVRRAERLRRELIASRMRVRNAQRRETKRSDEEDCGNVLTFPATG